MTALDRVHDALRRAGSTTRNGKVWTCPAHDDRSRPNLSVDQGEEGAVLICRAGCQTDNVLGALGLAKRDLFDDALATAPRRDPRPPVRVEILGPPTDAQIRALGVSRRVLRPETLAALGIERVRALGAEWIGIPARGGSWKLWAIDADGRPRLDGGKLTRRNGGPVSLAASPTLRADSIDAPVERLYDVEGESDLIATVDARLAHVVCGTGGAGSLAGHERHREWLLALRPGEVCIIRDLDDAGRSGAATAAEWWRAQGVPVRIVALPDELGEHGDLRDYLNGRAARNDAAAVEPLGGVCDLDALAERAELVLPSALPNTSGGVLIDLSTIEPRSVQWIWAGRIPRGKLTVLDGDPGVGKSTITLDLAARVSTGEAMPDGTAGTLGGVVLLSAEDDPADTIVPRLRAAGADLSRTRALMGKKGKRDETVPLSIPEDLPTIESAIVATGAVLVVVDPFMAYLSSEHSSHKDQDVRRALAPFAALAERTGCAVLIVRHLNKSAGGNALYRGGGSIGIIGAARSGLLAAPDPDDDSRGVLAVTKSNLARRAPSLAYSTVATGEVCRIEWLGESTHSAAALLASPVTDGERSAVNDAAEFLREELSRGAIPARELLSSARSAGYSEASVRRARKLLGVERRKTGMHSGWVLELPKGLKNPEGAQPQNLSAFDQVERLRDDVSAKVDTEEHLV